MADQEGVSDGAGSSVYESIALHFSNTRYKPWPLIPAFLNSFPTGSVGADLGCGNGKYLSLRSVVAGKVMQDGIVPGNDILTLGLDRSAKLVDLARNNIVVGDRVDVRSNRNEVVVGDAIRSSYRSQSLDFALSIATIHHFSTAQRRVQAVQELIRIVCPISQKQYSKIQKQQLLATKGASTAADYAQIAQRTTGRFLIYVWALEQRGESRRRFEDVAGQAEEGGQGRDLLVPWVLKTKEQKGTEETPEEEKVFQRCEWPATSSVRPQSMLTLALPSDRLPRL